ncbi:MAG: transporter [Mesorhizobium sp.]|uniref:TolC family outer membrane protein n=1 Tax=unclassified Mesorhizobium TaxID=325217 RepID=UPI000F750E69|nr:MULTISPECIES: TolC family outer membrane protein [unclassified Mesorhizobium]TGV93503.1 transporter [Mesorhizobium sp. M00.F.Ca.ET.158.01.1.1]AZO62530.1 transporter [Mesorhizobium sp. M1A.F.Ca.IN.022.06.1.1]MCT2577495.1 TolC family outer membrane protein [Mesorhizobium sp. P13.3]MDF3166433.1 TolC family outer membrane protein [Mesorhizobium sp. P16.1]MDF3180726.1 TolC family outer membrane protein [Mesorhizobium sp. P17.1]
MPPLHKTFLSAILVSATALSPLAASAETITGALAKAYQYNSQLNSARAGTRVTDEGVAIAKSGYRPTIRGSASIDYTSSRNNNLGQTLNITTGNFGVEIDQTLFDGFQTKNNVAAAEAQVRASQESLRNTEENILFNAASAYMDVIRDRQIAVLTAQNLQFLTEQARAARSRFEVGEGTRTDVAQADASRATAVAQLASARATALASAATYHQIIGDEPGKLRAAAPVGKLLPGSLDSAFAIAAAEHPAILATEHLVDAAAFSVKSAEGALLPQLSASAGISSQYRNTSPGVFASAGSEGTTNSANIGATLTVPIYSGGRTSALVRQSKESLSQARIEVDVSRDQVRQAVASAWTQYTAARESVDANRQVIAAAQLALNGVIEERNVGQRTTLDVLNAQNAVITAKINQASSERDVVVASYAILSAIGRLSAGQLGLAVTKYNPEEHYNAVKDKWIGLRTPDGR